MDDSLASEPVFPSSGEVAVAPGRRVATIGPPGKPLQERQNRPYPYPRSPASWLQSVELQGKARMEKHARTVPNWPDWRFGGYSKFRG